MTHMTLGEKLSTIRRECGLSQEAIGAQGFISAPGWIKLENEQRSPSEKLLEKLVTWLVKDKHVAASKSKGLKEELLTLKYLGSSSAFMRELAKGHARTLPNGEQLLIQKPAAPRKRGRPKLSASAKGK
jgi:transcriptional regulator with XRE-family HTH domain